MCLWLWLWLCLWLWLSVAVAVISEKAQWNLILSTWRILKIIEKWIKIHTYCDLSCFLDSLLQIIQSKSYLLLFEYRDLWPILILSRYAPLPLPRGTHLSSCRAARKPSCICTRHVGVGGDSQIFVTGRTLMSFNSDMFFTDCWGSAAIHRREQCISDCRTQLYYAADISASLHANWCATSECRTVTSRCPLQSSQSAVYHGKSMLHWVGLIGCTADTLSYSSCGWLSYSSCGWLTYCPCY